MQSRKPLVRKSDTDVVGCVLDGERKLGLVGHVAEGVELVRRDTAEGELDAQHVHIRLPLPVGAHTEAVGLEGHLLDLAVHELQGLGAEIGQLVL